MVEEEANQPTRKRRKILREQIVANSSAEEGKEGGDEREEFEDEMTHTSGILLVIFVFILVLIFS